MKKGGALLLVLGLATLVLSLSAYLISLQNLGNHYLIWTLNDFQQRYVAEEGINEAKNQLKGLTYVELLKKHNRIWKFKVKVSEHKEFGEASSTVIIKILGDRRVSIKAITQWELPENQGISGVGIRKEMIFALHGKYECLKSICCGETFCRDEWIFDSFTEFDSEKEDREDDAT